jgi:AcrR family transcriptional regulator
MMGRPSLASTRRPQILRAFEDCVLKYGLEGSSLERIAQQAGVRRSLIRHYFGNRDELTEALIAGIIERTVAESRDLASTAGAGGGGGALAAYLTGSVFADKRDDALVDALMAVSHRDPGLRAQLRRKYRAFQKAIELQLRRSFPAAATEDIHATAYGLMCLAVGSASMHDIELPASKRRHARRSAMQLISSLRDASATPLSRSGIASATGTAGTAVP